MQSYPEDSEMKVCAFMQVYNELLTGNLKRCITNLKKYCDIIAVYNDGSTDGSAEYLEKKENCCVLRGGKNDFKNETNHYQQLLDFILEKHKDIDWFFFICADEILSKVGIEKIRGICEATDKSIDGFHIDQVNLWRSYGWYRTDFYAPYFMRLWRNKAGMKYDVKYGLHHQQYPKEINSIQRIVVPDIKIIHYAFLTNELLISTYKKRVGLGVPVNIAKMRIDETNLHLQKVDLNWFPNDVKIGSTEKPTKKFFGRLPEDV